MKFNLPVRFHFALQRYNFIENFKTNSINYEYMKFLTVNY